MIIVDGLFTEKEKSAIIWMALPYKVAAHELQVSEVTIRFHFGNIMRKLGCSNRTGACAILAAAGYPLKVMREGRIREIRTASLSTQPQETQPPDGGQQDPALPLLHRAG